MIGGTHRAVFVATAQAAGWTRGVELGTGHGYLASALLAACPKLTLTTVDFFRSDRPDWRKAAEKALAPYCDRCRILACSSHDAADLVDNGTQDFVFIDAGHQYPSVQDDISRWRGKVRPGGWFGGHDYGGKHVGVKRAVDEAFGMRVQTAPGHIWWVTL